MVRCGSLFSQVLSLVNRMDFHGLVFKHDAEHHAKGYSSWVNFVDMLFCQLAQAKSKEHPGDLWRPCMLRGQDQASGPYGLPQEIYS